MTNVAALRVDGLSKSFGNVAALKAASLELKAGHFHALLGENGAGKSTLAKCVAGISRPDSGVVSVDGIQRQIHDAKEAHRWGIGMVHQHFSLAPNLTVAENLIVAQPSGPAVINWRRAKRDLEQFCTGMPFRIDIEMPTASLAAGEKQKVEIIKQLYLGHHVLLLDEPTSVLTIDEADQLFGFLRQIAADGRLSVLLITHKLREVFKFADHVTVLRRGQVVADGETAQFDSQHLAHLMIGDENHAASVERNTDTGGEAIVEIRDLCILNDRGLQGVSNLDATVHRGEILGIAGVSGNGQRELLEALAGQRTIKQGKITLHGEAYRPTRAQMVRHKINFLPEEPLRNASVASMSVAENLALRNFDRAPITGSSGLLNHKAMRRQASDLVAQYKIRVASIDMPIRGLSGGNVQRAVLARELSGNVEILIAANPCFGLDIGAVNEIHAKIIEARNGGAAVLLISEDLDELIALSDRIAVMFEGRIVFETDRGNVNPRLIGRYMTGHSAAA